MQVVSRRFFLASCSAVPLLALLPAFAPAAATAQRPRARVEPVVDTYFGEQVVDPYRWMENANDPEWAPHLRGQTAYARSILDSIPGRSNLQRRIAELSSAGPSVNSVRLAGSQLYYLKRPAGAAKAGLWTRPLAGGEERLLVDPDSWPGSANTVVREFSISPDGRLLLFGIDEAGREMPVFHLIEIGTGTLRTDRISRAFVGDVPAIYWRPDGAGFFYLQFADGREPGATNMLEDAPLRFHRLGDPQTRDVWVVRRDGSASIQLLPTEWLVLVTWPESPFAILSVGDGVGGKFRLYSAPLASVTAGAPAWTPIAGYEDEVVDFALAGDDLYLLSVKDAPNGRLSRTSASTPRLGAARTIRTGNAVIEKIKVAADGLYIQTMDGGYGGLKRVGRGGRVSDVTLPYDGGIYELSTSPSADGAILRMSGWTEPMRSWRFDPDQGRTVDLGLLPPSPHDLSGYQVVRTFTTSGDGTRVPLSLVMKKGLPRDGSNPCLIEAYGAYGDSLPPAFLAYWLAFLELGGIIGTAHVRGGGEYGHRWHLGGYKSSKPNSWRDLIACAEEAVRQGFTSPARLAILGGSAGGITVGRAMTERPDLFAAVVSQVGLNNTLRLEAGQNGSTSTQEFGSVATREGYAALRSMDSYHHVRDGQDYPAVLLTTGINDPRVATWQVVKMAARLQAAGSSNPVLMRVDEAAGHGGGSTVAERASQLADDYAFVLWRTGHRQFQRNGLGEAPTA